jgi:hypothetical protein
VCDAPFAGVVIDYLSVTLGKPIAGRMSTHFAGEIGQFPSGEILVGNEGVGPALDAECRERAVARHECHVIAQRPKPLADRLDKRAMITAKKIRPADRALKQHVADKGEP